MTAEPTFMDKRTQLVTCGVVVAGQAVQGPSHERVQPNAVCQCLQRHCQRKW